MSTGETIFALSTPPGKSAVAVLRVSGPQACTVLSAITGIKQPEPNSARYVAFRDPVSKAIIDKGIALYFACPKSFTGEDMAEFHTHGSLAVVREMTEAFLALGIRPAEPGEFSRRAFLGGKMDLIEAEGLADLIDAESIAQKTQALRQVEGELSVYYEEMRARIIKALAHLEAYIDFPDEEIPESALATVKTEIDSLKKTIHSALQDNRRGERVREGIRIVILGAPNAGKSSLLNALAGRDAAIVSHRAGTTRDVIEVHMDIAGYPVILTDTAGLRASGDEIEEEGVRRAMERAGEADIRLVLLEAGQINNQIIDLINKNSIILVSKSDLLTNKNIKLPFENKYLLVSSKTGEGLADLINLLKNNIMSSFSGAETPVITRARHRALLSESLHCLERFSPDAPLELACEGLRSAASVLGKITGRIQVDDVLDVIFKQFCIGK